jgi:hypothetical protein
MIFFESGKLCNPINQSSDSESPYLVRLIMKTVYRKNFLADTPAFTVYSFADIRDAQTAREAKRRKNAAREIEGLKWKTDGICSRPFSLPLILRSKPPVFWRKL